MIALGINYTQMHDSSACIVRDGEILFAVAEERLSRMKQMRASRHWRFARAWNLPACDRTSWTSFARDGRRRASDSCTI
jgi:predicted NodU family carbamoyl transferase